MPSTGTPEQKQRWANSKKKRKHESNVEAIEAEFNAMNIDINDIGDIPAVIAMLKKLARIRKREAFLKETGILPKISDDEWSKFNRWLRVVHPMLVGYAVEAAGPRPPNEVATEIIELALQYAIAFDFIDAYPIEARSRVLELYAEVCGSTTVDPEKDRITAAAEAGSSKLDPE